MCRLFGFRSVIQSQVHRSLVDADNALAQQSRAHPHGWGVAYYLADTPHVVKSADHAVEDQIFRRVSGVVASETVIAHVRKATVGPTNILNSHPFQYGQWVFAHNGDIAAFASVRDALMGKVLPRLRRYVFGDTDSEVLFYLFLTFLSQRVDLHRRGTPMGPIVDALTATVDLVQEVADPGRPEGCDPSKLSLLVTDGQSMVGVRRGPELRFSTYKDRCGDRETCPYLAAECEAETTTGFVNHLIVSSEELQGENVWIELGDREYVGVDWRMRLYRGHLGDGADLGADPPAPAKAGAAVTV